MSDKVPSSVKAEESILGCIIADPRCADEIYKVLTPEMFFLRCNKELYKILLELSNTGAAIDDTIIIAKVGEYKLQDVISEIHVHNCANSVVSASNISTYAKIVAETYLKRETLKIAESMKNSLYNKSDTAMDVIEDSENGLFNIARFNKNTKIVDSRNIVEIGKNLLQKKRDEDIIYPGYENLAELLTSGFPVGDISIIAGCPSNLKSTFRSNLEIEMIKKGVGVVTIATEQTLETELFRKISVLADVPFGALQSPGVFPGIDARQRGDAIGNPLLEKKYEIPVEERVKRAFELIQDSYNYTLLVDRGLSIKGLRRELERLLAKNPKIKFVSVDLFDRLEEVRDPQNKAQNVAKCLAEMNEIVEELELHISLLVQIRRDSQGKKGGKDPRPQIWEIKDSGAYQEVARLIFLLFREKLYIPSNTKDTLEVNIAKQSNGEAGPNINANYIFNSNDFSLSEPTKSDTNFTFGEDIFDCNNVPF